LLHNKDQAGFTFIELLIVVLITAVLAVSSIPVFLNLYQEYHLNTNIQKIYYVMQLARSEAIKANRTIYANFQTGDNWCFGFNTSSCNCLTANSCALANYTAAKTADMNLTTTGMTGGNIQFDGARGATYSTTRVTLTIYNKTPSVTLKISSLGNLQLCSDQLSGYPTCS
jgi:prepilin-type N-terminal cleavage/methylation domain-containing protein